MLGNDLRVLVLELGSHSGGLLWSGCDEDVCSWLKSKGCRVARFVKVLVKKGRRRDSQAQAAMTNESDAGWSTDEANGRSQASSSVSYLQHKDTCRK